LEITSVSRDVIVVAVASVLCFMFLRGIFYEAFSVAHVEWEHYFELGSISLNYKSTHFSVVVLMYFV
jgi:hypothetical protein